MSDCPVENCSAVQDVKDSFANGVEDHSHKERSSESIGFHGSASGHNKDGQDI